MLISSSHKGCLRPTGPRSARSSGIRLPYGRTGPEPRRLGLHYHLRSHACGIVRANVPRDSTEPVQQHPDESNTMHKVSVAAKQLLSVTALAFFSLVAIVAKDRVTNPIVPPFLPPIETLTSATDGASSSRPQAATATVELPDTEAFSTSTAAAAKPSRSLLRALWGTATLPVKLVDALLFPEEALVGTKPQAPASSTTAELPAAPQRSQQQPKPAATAAAASTGTSSSSVLPAADTSAAAAGERLAQLSRQVEALAAAAADSTTPATKSISTTASAALQRLQDAVAYAMQGQQGSVKQPGSSSSSSAVDHDTAAAAADTAAVLAVVRMALGPEGMGLLPVLLVTSATAVAGVMLAASFAGFAGLLDSRRASTPAQRAATAALLDSPLRPISCPTWPGFFPMLPASIEPTYYRWRDADTPAVAAPTDAAGDSSTASRTAAGAPAAQGLGEAAAAAAAQVSRAEAKAAAAAKAVQDQPGWWSFAQIAALRMMPLLPESNTSASAAAAATSASSGSSTGAGSKQHGAGAAAAEAAAASATAAASAAVPPPAAAAASAALVGAAALNSTDSSAPQLEPTAPSDLDLSWDEVKDELAIAASEIDYTSVLCVEGGRATNSADISLLVGSAWEMAMQLVVVDWLSDNDGSEHYNDEYLTELVLAFAGTAPVEVLAEVCCLLPAAAARVRRTPDIDSPYAAIEHASELLQRLLAPTVQTADRRKAVCAAMGLVGTAAQPRVLEGVLQQRCRQFVTESAVLDKIEDVLTYSEYAEVPDVAAWLRQEKQQRVNLITAALTSTAIAAFEVAEACAQWGFGAEWAEPRLVLQHAVLMQHMLEDPFEERDGTLDNTANERMYDALLGWVYDQEILELCSAGDCLTELPESIQAVTIGVSLDRPVDSVCLQRQFRSSGRACFEIAAARAAMETHSMELEEALWPVAESPVPRSDAVCEDTVMTNVCAALRAGVLVVKTSQTQLPFQLRPAWPTALALAAMDWFLLPTTSARLQRRVASSLVQTVQDINFSHTLVLLPAAVAHVKAYERSLVMDSSHGGAEDASSICMRMYKELLPEAMQDPEYHLGMLLQDVGFNPSAVAAAAAASGQPDSADALAQLFEGQRLSELEDERLLSIVFELMWDTGNGDRDAERTMMSRPILMSMAVFLALILDLAGRKGWVLDPADTSGSKNTSVPLPPWFWADVAGLYAEGSVSGLPGGAAAAAVLQLALQQSQLHANLQWRSGTRIYEIPLLESHFHFASEQLTVDRSDDSTSTGSSSHAWERALAAAAEPPPGVDYDGDEQWREKGDLHQALLNDSLPWDVDTSDIPGFEEQAEDQQTEDESAEDEGAEDEGAEDEGAEREESGSGVGQSDGEECEEECDQRVGSSDSDSYSTTATAGGSYAEEADAAVGSQEEYAEDFDVPDASADAELAEDFDVPHASAELDEGCRAEDEQQAADEDAWAEAYGEADEGPEAVDYALREQQAADAWAEGYGDGGPDPPGADDYALREQQAADAWAEAYGDADEGPGADDYALREQRARAWVAEREACMSAAAAEDGAVLGDSEDVEVEWEQPSCEEYAAALEKGGLGSQGGPAAAAAAAAAGESSGPSCADIRKLGWQQGWGAPQEPLDPWTASGDAASTGPSVSEASANVAETSMSVQSWEEEERAEQKRQKKLRNKARKKARRQAEQQAKEAAAADISTAQGSPVDVSELTAENFYKHDPDEFWATLKGTYTPAVQPKATAPTAAAAGTVGGSQGGKGSPKVVKGAAEQQGVNGSSSTQGSQIWKMYAARQKGRAAQGSQHSGGKGTRGRATQSSRDGAAQDSQSSAGKGAQRGTAVEGAVAKSSAGSQGSGMQGSMDGAAQGSQRSAGKGMQRGTAGGDAVTMHGSEGAYFHIVQNADWAAEASQHSTDKGSVGSATQGSRDGAAAQGSRGPSLPPRKPKRSKFLEKMMSIPASDSTDPADLMIDRLALMMAQAVATRDGDDEQRLQAAVGGLAAAEAIRRAVEQQRSKGSGTQGSIDGAAQGSEQSADKGSEGSATQGSEDGGAQRTQRSTAVEDAVAKGSAGAQAELVPTVKKLLGLPVQASDSTNSTDTADLVTNRLTLLMCQAMLMRGDDAEQRLQAAVGYLAAAEAGKSLQLPLMLSGCMEALFSGEDWLRSSGSARQVLSTLSGALPAQQYMSLQQHLMAKGLIRELEVPAEFDT